MRVYYQCEQNLNQYLQGTLASYFILVAIPHYCDICTYHLLKIVKFSAK